MTSEKVLQLKALVKIVGLKAFAEQAGVNYRTVVSAIAEIPIHRSTERCILDCMERLTSAAREETPTAA